VIVRASDGGGDSASVAIAENTTAVTTVTSTDVDGPAPTFSLAGGADETRFTINAATGALAFVAAPDFDAPGSANGDNSYEVIVRASDGSLSDDQTITVNVTNVNNVAPEITSDGGGARNAPRR
jgi:Cadherin domain